MTSAEKKQIFEIGDLIYSEFGIHIPHEKSQTLCMKIGKMLASEEYTDIDDIYMHLMGGDRKCLDILIRYITTNHTFFFRESEHFKRLVKCIQENPRSGIKIWCAACSSGEEPYSIAMTLLESGIHDFKIIASDIDSDVLKTFKGGIYNESRFVKTPKVLKLRYFISEGNSYYRINPMLRKYIAIKRLNLMDNLVFDQQVDYIFCRNVFIYFNDESRQKAIDTLVRNLLPGGRLFIGHTETLFYDPPSLRKDGHSVYKKL